MHGLAIVKFRGHIHVTSLVKFSCKYTILLIIILFFSRRFRNFPKNLTKHAWNKQGHLELNAPNVNFAIMFQCFYKQRGMYSKQSICDTPGHHQQPLYWHRGPFILGFPPKWPSSLPLSVCEKNVQDDNKWIIMIPHLPVLDMENLVYSHSKAINMENASMSWCYHV